MTGQRTRPARLASTVVIAAGVLSLALAVARADDVAAPTNPVARAAFDVLEKHCARCHQAGRLTARERPASNFGFVLKLDQLAADPHYVLPGNPFGSRLLKQILDKEMPYDVMYEGADKPGVSEADIKALQSWIAALGDKRLAACDGRTLIGNKELAVLVAADLVRLPPAQAKTTRYLTLTNLANACTAETAMKVYRQGTIKLINSLSRAPEVVRPLAIDPAGTILRFNLADLGWDESDWNTLAAAYPYGTQPPTPEADLIERLAGTKLAALRADWFAYAASRPPLYNALLRLPPTFQDLQTALGVDVARDLREFLVARAGFQKSGVSRNNRMIERHASPRGYFWTSYDFAGNRARQNLFAHPLGPGGDTGFDPDGGETIFSLLNGFQAYYLNNATGKLLDKGPTEIVHDLTRKDLAVTNGISCMGCHDVGLRKAKDDVRALVLAGDFPNDVRDAVARLHPPHDKMDAIIAADTTRFADAMTRAGLDPALKLNGIEMINALSQRYEEDVDLAAAAAEFGLDKGEFETRSAKFVDDFKPTIRRLEQGVVPRDQFETMFVALAEKLTGEKPLGLTAFAQPVRLKSVLASPDLTLTSDKDAYDKGEMPVFTVVSSRDCYLTLMNVDGNGVGTVIFPNRYQPDNRILAGEKVILPGANAPFIYRLRDPGSESVIAVCAQQNEADGIRHDFTRSAFTEVKNYTRSLARAIVVEPRPAQTAVKVASTPQPATTRTAIRIRVR